MKAGEGKGVVHDVDLHSQHLLLDIISPIAFDYSFNLLDKSREAEEPAHSPLTPERENQKTYKNVFFFSSCCDACGRLDRRVRVTRSGRTDGMRGMNITRGVSDGPWREVITGAENKFVPNRMLEAYHRSAEIMGEVRSRGVCPSHARALMFGILFARRRRLRVESRSRALHRECAL